VAFRQANFQGSRRRVPPAWSPATFGAADNNDRLQPAAPPTTARLGEVRLQRTRSAREGLARDETCPRPRRRPFSARASQWAAPAWPDIVGRGRRSRGDGAGLLLRRERQDADKNHQFCQSDCRVCVHSRQRLHCLPPVNGPRSSGLPIVFGCVARAPHVGQARGAPRWPRRAT
jgi:hypothetical protein